jgi:hypothetical protein
MSCISCTTKILHSTKRRGDFHSYETLKASPPECLMCTRLREDLEEYDRRRLIDLTTVSHRWTLRHMTKVRETAEVVVVTLRATKGFLKPAKDDPHAIVYPPTRIFYLMPEEGQYCL